MLNNVTQYLNDSRKTGTIVTDNSASPTENITLLSSSGPHGLGENAFPIPNCTNQTQFDAGNYTTLTLDGSGDVLKFWQDSGNLYGSYGTFSEKFTLINRTQPGPKIGQIIISLQSGKPWIVGELEIATD